MLQRVKYYIADSGLQPEGAAKRIRGVYAGTNLSCFSIATHKEMLLLLGMLAILTVTMWPAATLLPVFAHDIFRRGGVWRPQRSDSDGVASAFPSRNREFSRA